jgi:hypothetical protein
MGWPSRCVHLMLSGVGVYTMREKRHALRRRAEKGRRGKGLRWLVMGTWASDLASRPLSSWWYRLGQDTELPLEKFSRVHTILHAMVCQFVIEKVLRSYFLDWQRDLCELCKA